MKIVKVDILKIVLACFCCVCIAGCSTPVQMPDASVPSIILKEAQTRKAIGGTVSVPAGVYTPDFIANDGIYYRAPSHLITKALGISSIERGGIFIPNPPTEAQKQEIEIDKIETEKLKASGARNQTYPSAGDFLDGVWFDQQEASGGLLVYAATSPQRIL